jgi:agmatine deiminase
MIPDWQTNQIYLSKRFEANERFKENYNKINSVLNSNGTSPKLLPDTNDIWARDYMPIQINENTFIEYRFDPDYLQKTRKGYRDTKTYPDLVCTSIGLKTTKSDIIMDGGNLVKSANCIILTEKIVKENSLKYSKKELIKKLHETFQVEKVVLIPQDKQERYGHSDGMVRFIDNETVVTQYYFKGYSAMLKPLQQAGLKIEYINYDVKKKDNKRNWAYLNFLQTNDLILLPKFGIDEDDQALEQIKDFYPDYRNSIAQVEMNDIVDYHGALNCISWTTME